MNKVSTMTIQETEFHPADMLGSGMVRRFRLPEANLSITQISTFCPDKIGPGPVNLYLIESDALVLLDAGIPTQVAKAFFYGWRNQSMPPEIAALPLDQSEQEFRRGMKLTGYAASDINMLAISHGHLDHFMMAGSLLNGSNATISAHILDTPGICNPWGLLNLWISRQDMMEATGMPPAKRPHEAIGETVLHGLNLETLGTSVRVDIPIMSDGPLQLQSAAVRGIEVRHLPGHSPGSIGLLVGNEGGQKVLLCGDVLLNPITPHPDDLLVYLQTLNLLESYDDVVLVLPAHGEEVRDLKARVRFLKEHHRNRLQYTYEACHVPCCVWDVATMENYFNTYVDPKKFNFLAGLEALVHFELLNMVGGIARTEIRDGVHYFRTCGEPFDEVYSRITELVENKKVATLMRY
jgi:glyoxylase-like metal-dependent hydrolase (beta-lactamase superfamily II)